MKYILFAVAFLGCFQVEARDFPPKMEDAAYLATLKAVLDYKMNDEETLQDIEKLRQNKKFKEALEKKLQKLDNSKSKNSANQRIYQMLIYDGKRIYDELN